MEGVEYESRDKKTVALQLLEQDQAEGKQKPPWRNLNRKLMHGRKIVIYSLLKAQQAGQDLTQLIPQLQSRAEAHISERKGKGKAPALLTQVQRILKDDHQDFFVPLPHEYEVQELKWKSSTARAAQATSRQPNGD